jgi:ETC complex I subunit conserved region
MQSGKRNTRDWILEFEPSDRQAPDPLMGWPGSSDTQRQLRMRFPSREAAEAYAQRHEISYAVQPEQDRALKIQTYADNFR